VRSQTRRGAATNFGTRPAPVYLREPEWSILTLLPTRDAKRNPGGVGLNYEPPADIVLGVEADLDGSSIQRLMTFCPKLCRGRLDTS
jgi:hypothetical protein